MMSLDTEAEQIVGALHDVVEDSDWTFEDLEKEGFGPEVMEALKSVTKNDDEHGTDEGYFRFVERARQNPIGLRVKIADLEDNMDVSRLPGVDERTRQRIDKYRRSLNVLLSQEPSL
jgi:(p)ppGpp synthase/HD superfamily hydrolase